MRIAIVTHFDVVSHFVNANRIANVFTKQGHECKLYNFDAKEVPEDNILYVYTFFASSINYLSRFLPEKRVVFYTACEGFPILDPISSERTLAKEIKIVANSDFTKMCLEATQLPCEGVVPHGLQMDYLQYDKKFYEYVKTWTKEASATFFCLGGNYQRKGLDRYILASKLVSRKISNACFILHSGKGDLNIPAMINNLELSKNFWFTNSFGLLHEDKINALYKLCTAYVQPSYCESFCIPTIEAFRFHRPVITIDAPPMNEIVINGETGILIPSSRVQQVQHREDFVMPFHLYSVDDLTDAMIKMAESKHFKPDLIRNIGEARKRYDAGNVYPKLLGFF